MAPEPSIEDLNRKVQELESELDAQANSSEALKNEYDELDEINKTLKAELAERNQAYEKLKEGFEKLGRRAGEKTIELTKEKDQMGEEIDVIQKQISTLQEESLLNQAFIDAIPDIAFLVRPNNEVVLANKAAIKAGTIVGEECFKTWGQESGPCDWCLAPDSLDSNKTLTADHQENGKTWEVMWIPIQKDLYLHLVFDLTEKRERETKGRLAQHLKALGIFAGGIANDLNNLLTGVQGHLSLMSLESDASQPSNESIKEIKELIGKIGELTLQLLEFASAEKHDAQPIDLIEIIQETANRLGDKRKDISINPSLDEDIWETDGDAEQIGKMLTHLYENASQTMPQGGDLYLKVENVILDEKFVLLHGALPGKYIKISITDTGLGTDEYDQTQLFNPFFTSRELGRGRALGLAFVYGIVKNHNGIIDVYSEIREGTTFNIYLPATVKARVDESATDRETRTLLLVDDEDVIIRVAMKMIARLGYEGLVARNGLEAVEIYQTHPTQISLVVLDMVMPKMDGPETFNELKKINPNIKVLITSGYGITDKVKKMLDQGGEGFIQKPFDLDQLSEAISDILGK